MTSSERSTTLPAVGVIDQNVGAAQLGFDAVGRCGQGVGVGDVGLEGDGAGAGPTAGHGA